VDELGERAVFVPADVTDAGAVTRRSRRPASSASCGSPSAAPGSHRPLGSSGARVPTTSSASSRPSRVNLVGTFNVLRLAAAAMAELEPVDGDRG
jgi:hypothetical protein